MPEIKKEQNSVEKQELENQLNDVIDYINFTLMIRMFESDEKLIESGLKYAKVKNYNVNYIREQLIERKKNNDG